MRGEHPGNNGLGNHHTGSSPHARGTPHTLRNGEKVMGIIPACAGNTRFPAVIGRLTRDHPRMRGEHFTKIVGDLGTQGSSPHARGTPSLVLFCRRSAGIIPACAGNTVLWGVPKLIGLGSSPHARGTPGVSAIGRPGTGIIPACAGNTKTRRCQRSLSRDHPRMRGEH